MQGNVELADLIDSQWIFCGALSAAINPWPSPIPNPGDGFFNGGTGQTKFNRRVNDLRQRSQWRRFIERFLIRHYILRRYEHILQNRGTAAGGTLAEAAPIVDHFETVGVF